MYKIFKGFHLVEAYHEFKKAKRLTKNQTVARCIKLAIAMIVALVLWFLPIDSYGIEGLTIIEQRLISIFIFATLMWIFEAIPAWTTSVLIVVLLLLSVSDSSLWLFTENIPTEESCTASQIQSSCCLSVDLFLPLQLPKADLTYCWLASCYSLSARNRAMSY